MNIFVDNRFERSVYGIGIQRIGLLNADLGATELAKCHSGEVQLLCYMQLNSYSSFLGNIL